MTSRLPRARLSALLVLVTAGAVPFHPASAPAAGTVAAVRGTPSSLSARYGAAVSLGAGSPGRYLVPTRTGFEIREASLPSGDSLIGVFRTAGRMDEAAVSGATVWLAAESRGLLAVDITSPANPVLLGSVGGLGTVRHVAVAPGSGTVAAAADSALYLFHETGGGSLSLLALHRWTDGRLLQRVLGRNDSILVAAFRPPAALPRLFLTLFQARAGAVPESLWDFQANGHEALDAAWQAETAFLADGDNGILPFHLPTRTLRPSIQVSGNRSVQSVDANDSLVVAALGVANAVVRFRRGGAFGDSLTDESDAPLPLTPAWVRLIGNHAILPCNSEAEQPEPDEVGRSALVDRDFSTGVTAPPAGGTGRVRRVVQGGGLAYVADYTGGLRIYRSAPGDSSLVGALPIGAGRTYDVALDAARRLAYLASGPAGVQVVDVTDPASPALLATVPLAGDARCIAAIGDTLVAAGWRKNTGLGAGVTFIDVSNPSSPLPRGSVSSSLTTTIQDPRALAPRDTVLFVADNGIGNGLISATFGNPDLPGIRGLSSLTPARSLDLAGTTLVVATHDSVQVVDVTTPTFPLRLSGVPLPTVQGVTLQGGGAVAFLGDEGAVVIDLSNRSAPVLRGAVESPGFPRSGVWSGDTLLVASSFGLERFTLPASLPAEPALVLSYDESGGLPRVTAAWPPVLLPGTAGLSLYRELAGSGSGGAEPVLLNPVLLPVDEVTYLDESVPSAGTYRYRLVAVLQDGSAREVAVGRIFISATARVGRPYPNPFRASSARALAIPFRSGAPAAAVRARIYDVRGRLIRTITAQVGAAGRFGTVTWDGRDERGVPAASGLYWVHVQAPGIDDARSVVLVR